MMLINLKKKKLEQTHQYKYSNERLGFFIHREKGDSAIL